MFQVIIGAVYVALSLMAVFTAPMIGEPPEPPAVIEPSAPIQEATRLPAATATMERRTLDLSGCNTLHIEGPLDRLSVSNGRFSLYAFKRYGGTDDLKITCETEKRKRSTDMAPPASQNWT